MNESGPPNSAESKFDYAWQTQAPNRWWLRMISGFVGFLILVYVSIRTGIVAAVVRRLFAFLWTASVAIGGYLFDRYFDARRLAEWTLMLVSPQLYAAWKTCVCGYVWISGVWSCVVYVLDKAASILSIFGIRSTVSDALRRETSVDSLRRAPISRETSHVKTE